MHYCPCYTSLNPSKERVAAINIINITIIIFANYYKFLMNARYGDLVTNTPPPITRSNLNIYIYSNAVYELFNLIQILDRISKLSPFVNLNICTCRNQFCRPVSSQTVCNEHQLWAILLLGWIIHSFFHSLTNWKGYLCFCWVKT